MVKSAIFQHHYLLIPSPFPMTSPGFFQSKKQRFGAYSSIIRCLIFIACKPILLKINTLYEKVSIEVEGKHSDLDILIGGDMKFLQLVLGLGGSLYNYSGTVHGIGSIKTTRGQTTCYCPRKMLFPRSQITRRKLCFYYTCKFGVISIKYVIRCSKH